MALYNRVKVSITAGGTGNLTLGSPVAMFQGFGDAGVPTGTVVSYVIEDAVTSAWEYGRGTYTAPLSFARTTVLATSAGNTTPINAGTAAVLFIDALAEDFAGGLTVGTTPIAGGTSNRVVFNNGGTFGEAANLTYDGTATSARQLKLTGATSGAVTLQTAGAAGTYTLTLPNSAATANGQSLTSDTSGNLTWKTETPSDITFAATDRVLGRDAAGAGVGEELTASQVLDWIGATQGQVLYRSSAGWTALATGNVGQYLRTAGASANPTWADLPPYAVTQFSATATYSANDLVSYQGKIYRTNTALTPAAWDATKWVEIGAAQTFTAGSIPFADTGGALTEDNAALFWDKANKRLGVGTKTPDTQLHVHGTSWTHAHFSNTKTGIGFGLTFGVHSSTNESYFNTTSNATDAANAYLAFKVNSRERLKIDNDGRVYLTSNGTAATARFEIMNETTAEPYLQFRDSIGEKLRFTQPGQLLIGTTTAPTVAGALLSVNSDAQINGLTVGKGGGQLTNGVIGENALKVNTTGNYNTAIGFNVLSKNTTGSYNCSLGHSALMKNVSGSNNLAIGQAALVSNLDGMKNVSIGVGSIGSNTSGNNNIAVGSDTLYANVTGSDNCAIGTTSLVGATGSNNIGIGSGSGRYLVNGSNNVFIGGNYASNTVSNTIIVSDGALGAANSIRWQVTDQGVHTWSTGAPGASTEKMRLTTTGQLLVGATAAPTDANVKTLVNGSIALVGKTTAAIKALATPAKGSIEFSTDANALVFYDGTSWMKLSATAL